MGPGAARVQRTEVLPHPIGGNMSTAVMTQPPTLLRSAEQGDSDSFATLLEPLLDPAFRLAAVMLADRGAAEDAVQEASIKAWRKIGQLRGELASLRPWFLSIVANECRMTRRQRWWSVVRLADVPAESSQGEGSSSDLLSAVKRLKPEDRLP